MPFGRWAKRLRSRSSGWTEARQFSSPFTTRVHVLEDRTLLAAPVLVKDIETRTRTPINAVYPESVAVGSRLFFTATSPAAGMELYVVHPGDSEPTPLMDVWPGQEGSRPRELTEM